MALTLYFLRHGQTAQSLADSFSGSGSDPDLTSNGYEMAAAFAAEYKDRKWQAVYSSALRRTIATAQPVCDDSGRDLRERAELNEISYGVWEGQTKGQVERDFSDDYRNWLDDPSLHAPTGGETAVAVANRATKTIDEIRNEFSDGEVLVVSHKATIRIIICRLIGIELRGFRYRLACPVGSVNVVEFTKQGPMLKVLADRCHLSARLRNLPGT